MFSPISLNFTKLTNFSLKEDNLQRSNTTTKVNTFLWLTLKWLKANQQLILYK